jgi:hypothetical protein
MAQNEPQSFENHAKFVPAYHYWTTAMVVVLLLWAVVRLVQDLSIDRAMIALLTVTLAVVGLWARVFALQAQDRVIRLEERLRMRELLPSELHDRIGEFTTRQLIALRFASDAELPELARRVLEEPIEDAKTIKQAIKDWRPDHQRL